MSKTNWQALDARIAREVMGYSYSYAHGAACWAYPVGPRHGTVILQSQWQPHKDIAQGIQALEALSQKGVNYSITRFTKHEVIVQLWGYIDGTFCVRRRTGELVRQIVCLTMEAWMDAQEKQDDLG